MSTHRMEPSINWNQVVRGLAVILVTLGVVGESWGAVVPGGWGDVTVMANDGKYESWGSPTKETTFGGSVNETHSILNTSSTRTATASLNASASHVKFAASASMTGPFADYGNFLGGAGADVGVSYTETLELNFAYTNTIGLSRDVIRVKRHGSGSITKWGGLNNNDDTVIAQLRETFAVPTSATDEFGEVIHDVTHGSENSAPFSQTQFFSVPLFPTGHPDIYATWWQDYFHASARVDVEGSAGADVDFGSTFEIQGLTFEDGTTPEEHGVVLTFGTGRASPNVPEPSSLVIALSGMGAMGLIAVARRGRKKA